MDEHQDRGRTSDEGTIMVLVLIVTILLSLVVVGMARYATTVTAHGTALRGRADRVAAAEIALEGTIENLRTARSLCATSLARRPGGLTVPPVAAVPGIDTVVICEDIGSHVESVTAWAVVVTGEGTGGAPALTASQGAGVVKRIGGPVFLADPALASLAVPVAIVDGDLFHTDPSCAGDGLPSNAGATIANLSFEPDVGRGSVCTRASWREVFGDEQGGSSGPPIPDLDQLPVRRADEYRTVGLCRVFSPGIYSSSPQLASGGNYFESGDYRFDDVTLNVNDVHTAVTFGYPDRSAKIAAAVPNRDCATAQEDDPGRGVPGATIYLDGTSRIDVRKGALEILPRARGTSWVALQTLPGSALTATSSPVVSTANGENKEFASQGLVWAPFARIELGNITNRSTVQLHGGAVVAALHIGANASINSYAIEVPASPLTRSLLLTATATDASGGSSTIRVVVDHRAPREIAVRSWRVVN